MQLHRDSKWECFYKLPDRVVTKTYRFGAPGCSADSKEAEEAAEAAAASSRAAAE
jgi:hypothetical protein